MKIKTLILVLISAILWTGCIDPNRTFTRKRLQHKFQTEKQTAYKLDASPKGLSSELFKNRSMAIRQEIISREPNGRDGDASILRGLNWLKANQTADGAWAGENPVGMTSLALLAFLGHGLSKDGVVAKAVNYIVSSQTPSGEFGLLDHKNGPSQHALATMALSEYIVLSGDTALLEKLKPAVRKILSSQHRSGSWSYGYQAYGQGNSFNVGMQLLAIQFAERAGFQGPDLREVSQRALQEIIAWQDSNTGNFGYQQRRTGSTGVTGMSTFCLQLAGLGKIQPALLGMQSLEASLLTWRSSDWPLYSSWFAMLSAYQQGGRIWDQYRAKLIPQIIKNQKADGSWPPTLAETKYGATYATAIATLILETPYRYTRTQTPPPPFTWSVGRGRQKSFIMGGIPATAADVVLLGHQTQKMIASCDLFLMETHPSILQSILLRASRYPKGDRLQNHLSAATIKAVLNELKSLDVSEGDIQRFKPWALGLVGLDTVLSDKGKRSGPKLTDTLLRLAEGKQTGNLISADEWEGRLARLSDNDQRLFLEWILKDKAKFKGKMNRIQKAWRDSNREEVERVVQEVLTENPQVTTLYKAWVADENRMMAERISQVLADGKACFILLNAIRMDGVLKYLTEKGYSVSPL